MAGSIPGSGRFPWRRAWQPTFSCLENTMDRGVGWATIHGVPKSRTQLSDFHFQKKLQLCQGRKKGNTYEKLDTEY